LRKRPQFGLRFLFYLLTLSAICCVLLRAVNHLLPFPWLKQAMFAYLLMLTVYVAIRVPVLVSRHRHEMRLLAARRQDLSEWLEDKRLPNERMQNDDPS
jgi:hypothetical protein